MPFKVNGWPARIDLWTPQQWASIPADRRRGDAQLVNGRWVAVTML